MMPSLPMIAPPVNELGVVYLFSDFARRHRLKIIEIRAAFPDALVVRHEAGSERKFRVEFEFRASNFKQHKHDPRKCDWIVCWEDDWPDKPASLTIIELRAEYGLGWNIWWHLGQGWNEAARDDGYCHDGFHPYLFGKRVLFKNIFVPSRAQVGDLVFCHCRASKAACDRMDLDKKTFAIKYSSGSDGRCWLLGLSRITSIGTTVHRRKCSVICATLRRVVILEPPINGHDLFGHSSVNYWGDSHLSPTGLAARWPEIRRRLIQLRPSVEGKLSRYT